jgi:hypothetical protein
VTDSFAQPPPLSVLLVIPRKVVRVHSPYLDRGQDHSKGSVPGVLFLNSDPWGEDGKPLPSVILTWEPFAKVFWASWHWLHKWLDGVDQADTQEECSFMALVSDVGVGKGCSPPRACWGMQVSLWGQPHPSIAASRGHMPLGALSPLCVLCHPSWSPGKQPLQGYPASDSGLNAHLPRGAYCTAYRMHCSTDPTGGRQPGSVDPEGNFCVFFQTLFFFLKGEGKF